MTTSTLNAQTRAYGLSAAVTCVVSALLVVVKETNAGVFTLMKTLTVHHWVTHGLFDVLLFLVLGFILARGDNGQGPDIGDDTLTKAVAGGFLLGCVIIAAFYLFIG